MMPSALSGSNRDQLATCSSDRKRFIRLQARDILSPQRESGTLTWPTMVDGEASRISPSRIRTCMG
jgi:hypothetical protein